MTVRRGSDMGAVAILAALFALAMFFLGALVIEVGAARETRRNAQAAADTAALAAAGRLYQADYTMRTPDLQGALDEAKSYVEDNLTTAASASTYWAGCSMQLEGPGWTRSDNLPGITGGNPCVAFYRSSAAAPWTKVQVAVPGVDTPGFLGAVGGDIRAFAQAGTRSTNERLPVIFADSRQCSDTIDLSGSSVRVTGDIHSNEDIKVSGSDGVVTGTATYLDDIKDSHKYTWIPGAPGNPIEVDTIRTFPVTFHIADFRPGGRYDRDPTLSYYAANGTDKIDKGWLEARGLFDDATKWITPGIYYTRGEIDPPGSMRSSGVTFVSEGGRVKVAGSRTDIKPYVDDLLIFTTMVSRGGDDDDDDDDEDGNCSTYGVDMSGSSSKWEGIVFAPYSGIKMAGSSSVSLNGSLFGRTVQVSGSSITLTRPDSTAVGKPKLSLVR